MTEEKWPEKRGEVWSDVKYSMLYNTGLYFILDSSESMPVKGKWILK